MTVFDRRPRLRWAVPLAAVGLVLVGVLGAGAATADAGLPERSPADLLVALQQPTTRTLSGTVSVAVDLGLPDLGTGDRASGPAVLLTGAHTVRVWADGPQRSRVDLLGPRGEFDVVRNGEDLWTWSSADAEAAHVRLPAGSGATTAHGGLASGQLPSTPQQAADLVLSALDPTTTVTSSGVGSVAGRPVYDLVLTPTQPGTRIARVVISIDARTNTPLRVQVYSSVTGGAAIDVGFTSVDFDTPDPSVFAFTPPPGATVTEHAGMAAGDRSDRLTRPAHDGDPVLVGDGWTSVLVATAPGGLAGSDQAGALDLLPTVSGPWGTGRLMDGTLVSVIVTDDGRVALGAVTPQLLEAALAAP